MIQLGAGQASCTISPVDGGRLGALRIAGRQLIVERSDEDDSELGAMTWGSYPMAPWAGRLHHGRFRFAGVEHHVPVNLAPHAIHGTVFHAPWHVDGADGTSATLSCPLGEAWPFGGHASQRLELRADQLVCELAVTAGDTAMPAQVGWHPWFTKPRSAALRFGLMYARNAEGVPTGELIEPPEGPWDDCFVRPLAPLTLYYDDLTVTMESDCTHWVVYDEPNHATCVEPQSGPPDGFNLEPYVLAPRQRLTRSMRIRWAARRHRTTLRGSDDVQCRQTGPADGGPHGREATTEEIGDEAGQEPEGEALRQGREESQQAGFPR